MQYKDYYKIMGVAKDASQDEIKRSYRKLARKYHPDVSKQADAEERFKELGEAYEVLKDREKRTAYDELGSNWQAGQDFRPPPGWNGGQPGGQQGGFSDFFEEIFGRSQAGRRAPSGQDFNMQGEDRHARIQIDIEDSYQGATRQLSLAIPELTPDGYVQNRERTLSVKIPKGIREGQQIRLAGQGGGGMGSGRAGDLYLEVAFKPHLRYRASGKDVYVDVPVMPWEAALGDSVKVSTPSGEVKLKIPAGSQAGKTLRLKGGGLPGKSPGDFYAVLKLVNPPADTDRARAAFEQLRDELEVKV
ncbi:MAG: DnaJ C-terminal domain-containing protein [Xanthomonadales bacterium]|nr:DnaJ C-terminal domain-containing protein [Xanthomonadales bacterium]